MWTNDPLFLPQQNYTGTVYNSQQQELDPRRDYAARPFFLGKHAGYTQPSDSRADNPFAQWTPEWCDWEGGWTAGRLLKCLDRRDKQLSSQR